VRPGPARPQAGGPGRQRTSLKHLAALTGFSITTVSMVLNGRAAEFNLSAETRDLILAAAKEHNYQPNLHARSLRSQTNNILGLMVPTLSNRFFSEMAETFERLARRDRKLALLTVTDYDPQEEADTVNYFLSQDVECVFTANPTALARVSQMCTQAGVRQIVLDAPECELPTVSTDNRAASLELTRVLLRSMAAGGREGRAFFVGGMASHEVTQLRLAGFRTALEEVGGRFSPDQFVETPFDALAAHRALALLFARPEEVGGVFLNSLIPMDGLVRTFREAPEACRAVHYGVFDHHPMMDLLVDLHVASIRQDPERMMQEAYAIFSGRAAREGGPIHHVPCELILSPAMRRLLGGGEALAPQPAARGARQG
jgi:DNA-binding LacI/PurR family transcriptional regulator